MILLYLDRELNREIKTEDFNLEIIRIWNIVKTLVFDDHPQNVSEATGK